MHGIIAIFKVQESSVANEVKNQTELMSLMLIRKCGSNLYLKKHKHKEISHFEYQLLWLRIFLMTIAIFWHLKNHLVYVHLWRKDADQDT